MDKLTNKLMQFSFQAIPHSSATCVQLQHCSVNRAGRGQWRYSPHFARSIGLLASIVLLGIAHPTHAQTYPTGALQINDQGAAVGQLQSRLAELGYYSGTADGYFDASTQAAVVQFQQANGLSADGIVGRVTEAALYQTAPAAAGTAPVTTETAATYLPSTPSNGLLQLGMIGSEVSDLQTRLQTLGYYDGPISGSFGAQTQTALIAFQQAQGLTADGIAGPQVSAALGNAITASTPAPSAATLPVATTQTLSQPTTALGQPAQSATSAIMPTQVVEPTAQQPGATVQVPSIAPAIPPIADSTLPSAADPSTNRQTLYRNLESGRFSVIELQRRLQLRGFDPVEMNGVYDSATQDAIMQAQQAYGLSQSDLFPN